MRISDQILVLGNGGVKTTRTYEEDPKLMGYVVDLQAFDKALTEAQKNGTVLIEKNMITNMESANLTNKKNRKNISKHGDGCGIYARICLRASENKFSRLHHLLFTLSQAIPLCFERKTTALRA